VIKIARKWKNLPNEYRNILKGLGVSRDDYNSGIILGR